ncbi:MAG: ribosomal-processing cysteine protease Prp [Bacilli bacterium]|jgi:uncharacterized protein YsxB (DUF464 family)|nr:ribosomal-processing cysteine protease Prp [Bacilli bacterium]
MIRVNAHFLDNQINYIEITGHAGSGEYGHDLVCAGVSAITIGCLNSLNKPDSYQIVVEEGYVLVKEKSVPEPHDIIVLETMYRALKSVAKNEADYVKVRKRKVKGSATQ